jgi:hypothetical protein
MPQSVGAQESILSWTTSQSVRLNYNVQASAPAARHFFISRVPWSGGTMV